MGSKNSQFICQSCGATRPRWEGKCDSCGSWNSIIEDRTSKIGRKTNNTAGISGLTFVNLSGEHKYLSRHIISIDELDRVIGGGIVPGSSILLAGDPGIGKSTLLLQMAAALAANNISCTYISGEEGIEQVRLRANRLNIADKPVRLATATSMQDILLSLETEETPDIVVIDSIQTMYLDTLDSSPGSVSQVRAATQELIRFAKKSESAVLMVGHVTKEGQIAGPRILEHMVDTVLYFEGDRGHQFRIIRSVKNRFGPTDEIGVFEMTPNGLSEVPDPSALFLNPGREQVSGSVAFAGIEGTRPIFVEIQALVVPTSSAPARRTVVGWDSGRLGMILAVLEARTGLTFQSNDIFLNVAGGLRISEPAADLAVASAIVSSIRNSPISKSTVVYGEIGLSGEIRPVGHNSIRLKEANKLGFTDAIFPGQLRSEGKQNRNSYKLSFNSIRRIEDLVGLIDTSYQNPK